jgi:hypothetical protein
MGWRYWSSVSCAHSDAEIPFRPCSGLVGQSWQSNVIRNNKTAAVLCAVWRLEKSAAIVEGLTVCV